MQNLNTIGGLIEALTDLADCHGRDCEIAVALQPSWPLAARIAGLRHQADIAGEDDGGEPDKAAIPNLLWIAIEEGDVNGTPYAPNGAWESEEVW